MAETLEMARVVMRCKECGQRFGTEAVFCPFDGEKLERASWDPAGDPLLHRVIDGRYEVTGVLGEGGMGTVYQVRHTSLDRLFAMKVLRRDLASDPELAARFMREARATASVKHPNVVAINDFGRIEDAAPNAPPVPYFVMEHLVGQTLAHAIKAGGPLPAALGVRVALKIAAALGAAHAERIVHRDLKPDNVFVLGSAASSSDVDVRVVDFGAALVLGTGRTTKAGVVFGTPHYMSPEQAGGQPVDHRADVYALGVIMYEMFTGRVPFLAETYMGVLTQHLFVKPVPPSRVCERARGLGALEEVILRALEKRPDQRYGTMRELAVDVERFTAFGADGALTVAASAEAATTAASGPVFAMANELEPATREEVRASATRAEVRRARARLWATYGGIALGVAASSVALVHLLRPRHLVVPTPLSAEAVSPPPPTRSEVVAAPSATVSVSPAPPPSPAPRSAARPVRPTASPAGNNRNTSDASNTRTAAPAHPGDFADPWAK